MHNFQLKSPRLHSRRKNRPQHPSQFKSKFNRKPIPSLFKFSHNSKSTTAIHSSSHISSQFTKLPSFPLSTRLRRPNPTSNFSSISSHQKNYPQMEDFIALDAFARRQFQAGNESGFIDYPEEEFIVKVRELITAKKAAGETILIDGYAPFCKHIFIENFTSTVSTSIPISQDNKGLIETSYVARTEKELPVLSRYISRSKLNAVPKAKYLDLILYSRDQINIENANMGSTSTDTAEWGLISIKAQDVPFETPMQPITIMRNALGTEFGGSGITLDFEKYKDSVKFWDNHVSLV